MRCVVALHLLASGALVSACGSRSIPLVINLPSGASTQASAMEVYVVATCPSDTTRPPATSRAMSSWRRGEASQPLAGTLPERFGVLVIARDAMCSVVASRCVDATRNDERVVVDLLASTGPGCATSTCLNGLCVGVDARTTVPLDAPTMDAPSEDARLDAGTDAFDMESLCDCIDQDMDMRFDEGCGANGGGEVIWQTPFDGEGDQSFRSLVVGGDGRLYSNGWMSRAAMLCGRMLTTPADGRQRSWTFGFNAATGVCETALERSMPNEAPFASVWRGAEGVWMYVPGALVEMVNGAEVHRISLAPGADYNAGHVRALPSIPTRILASYRAGQGPFMAGAMSGTNNRGNIIAYFDSASAIGVGDVVTPGVAAWVDASTFVTIGPNTLDAPGCALPSGASRIEIRDIGAPNTCVRTFGTDFRLYEPDMELMTNHYAEQQTIVTGRTLWVIARGATRMPENGPISVRAFNLDDGTSHAFPLPNAPAGISPSVMLAPAADGTLFVGITSDGTSSIAGLDGRAGGYVLHLANDASTIRLLGSRRMAGAVAGLDVGPDGTVFVLSGTSDEVTLCQRDGTHPSFTPTGNGYVLTAIDFTP